MKLQAKIVTGPETSKVSKEDAEKQLRSHPAFPKSAAVELEEVEGRWVAAIATATKEAGPFPPSDDEGPPAEEKPEAFSEDGPPSDDGDGDSDDGGEAPDFGGEDKPEGDGEKKEKGEKGLDEVLHLLTTLLTALGIHPEGPDSLIPGEEGPPAPPGGDVPPPGPPAAGPDDGKHHTVHERSLKPGESPPGSTPIGAPSFAAVKVADDHPWRDAIGVKRSFPVEEPIGDASLADVKAELDSLAEGTGYSVKQLVEGKTSDGQRTAKALISS